MKKFSKPIFLLSLFFVLSLSLNFFYSADKINAADVAEVEVAICPNGEPGSCDRSWASYISDFYKFFLRSGSILVVLMLVYAGYILLTSQGDSGKITTAKEIILGSILGLIILILIPLFIRFLGLPDL